MSNLICQIVTRKIYAYVAEIFGEPVFWDNNWCLIVDVIWQDNGYPLREKMVLKFDTKEDAERMKVGMVARVEERLELV